MSEFQKGQAKEKVNSFLYVFPYLKIILRLTKVRHEGSMHMPPLIHTKAILKTTPFGLLNSGETNPSIDGKIFKDTQQTTKVFPFGMTT